MHYVKLADGAVAENEMEMNASMVLVKDKDFQSILHYTPQKYNL